MVWPYTKEEYERLEKRRTYLHSQIEKFLKIVWAYCVIFVIMGSLYLNIEVLSRWWSGDLIGLKGISRMTLAGWTSLWMLPVGGLCGLLLGMLNEFLSIRRLKPIYQSLLGTVIILIIEYFSGLILNVSWHLSVWDYSHKLLNLQGQICLQNAIGFFMITPFVFWLDDLIKSYLFFGRRRTSLRESYKVLFNFKIDSRWW